MDKLVVLKDLSGIGKEYSLASLNEIDLCPNPIDQFILWIDDAINAGIEEPNAMILSTVSNENKASARTVLLKFILEKGFVFFTNYQSRKGKHLQTNPFASSVFYWPGLERQVRIEGKIEKVSNSFSDTYFNSRSKNSQLAAIASQQSKPIPSRDFLLQKIDELEQSFMNKKLVRPYYWGGYILIPTLMEFWQGRPNRLNDRLQYRFDKENWVVERLAP